jgi:hypothetical protein
MTLLEIIIAMTIGTFLLGAISAAVIAAFDVTGVATASLTQTNDRQLVQIWFPRDVQSAQKATKTAGATCAIAQPGGPPAGTKAVVRLEGNGERFTTTRGVTTVKTTFYEVDYVLEAKSATSGGERLVRYFCYTPSSTSLSCTASGSKCTTHETVSYDLTLTPAKAATASVSGAHLTTVKLTITERPTTTTRVHSRRLGKTAYSISGWERS